MSHKASSRSHNGIDRTGATIHNIDCCSYRTSAVDLPAAFQETGCRLCATYSNFGILSVLHLQHPPKYFHQGTYGLHWIVFRVSEDVVAGCWLRTDFQIHVGSLMRRVL